MRNNYIELIRKDAFKSKRRRAHYNFHNSYNDVIQKTIIYMCSDSYIPPHYHYLDHQLETFILINGEFIIYIFDELGYIVDKVYLNKDNPIHEINTNIIHTLIACSVDAVLLEVKQGPFCAKTAKAFPEWVILENDNKKDLFFQWLKSASIGHKF